MPKGNANPVIAGCGIHHLAIQSIDLEQTFHFYRDTLGMKLKMVFERPERTIYLFDAGDGCCVEIFPPPADAKDFPPQPSPFPIMHLALTTTNVRAAVEVVRKAGYKIRVEPTDLVLAGQPATIAFVTGPNGEDVEFFQVP